MARILVVDDEPNLRASLVRALQLAGHEAGEAEDGGAALAALDGGGYDLAILDLSMPVMDGLEVLAQLKERGEPAPVIILTAHGSVEKAVSALQRGAVDFLEKPPVRDHLLHAVDKALAHANLRREVEDLRRRAGEGEEMIGSGPLMEELRRRIALAAPSDGRVLITGENGTGKELVARDIHQLSRRAGGPFVKLNCAAVPAALFESELFGHVRGAFTDASRNRAGCFERAHGGTLFLDEIGEMPPDMQAKLLRALESGEIQRVGGEKEIRVDVRLVAASNRDLDGDVARGDFREDLFYRLNVIRLHVPPLRERLQDLPALADRFLAACCRRNGYPPRRLERDALRLLSAHRWPGNVRELRNAMERLAILVTAETIGAGDVRLILPESQASHPAAGADAPLRERLAAAERRIISEALTRHGWRMAETARALGLERSHLYKKVKAHGLRRPD